MCLPSLLKNSSKITILVTPEERHERAKVDKPEFTVKLKDTELAENTYLRFMVKVRGDPNPDVIL